MSKTIEASILAAEAVLFAGVNAHYIHRMTQHPREFGPFVRPLYNFDTILFPALLAATGAGFSWRQRHTRDPLHGTLAGACYAAAAACVAARVYATHIEPRMLKVRRVRLRTSKLQLPLRVVHLSDMETDAVRRQEPRVIELVQSLNPDLVIHTGDLLAPRGDATYESELPKMAAVWSRLKPPLGKFTIMGEVDEPIVEELERGAVGGLRLLNGDGLIIQTPAGQLNLFGLSFTQSFGCSTEQTKAAVEAWFSAARPEDFTLLLGHRPDFILCAEHLPIDLCLAGHTHGGQVRVPFYGPISTQSKVPNELSMGYHQVGRTRLNVTAGVGFEHGGDVPAIRVNCPPELTVVDLLPG